MKRKDVIETILALLIFVIALLSLSSMSCVRPPKLVKWGTVRTQAVPEIENYTFKFTKLPAGTIPSNSKRILVGTETEIILKWPKATTFTEYEDQLDPIVFGTSSDSTMYVIPDTAVTYVENETYNASAGIPNLELSAGEYQVQLKNSIWSTWENREIYSKYNNAVGLYVDHTTIPLEAPAQLILELK